MKILFAVAKDDADYMEQLITETDSPEHLEKARAWALEHGFKNLRVWDYNGEKPDFKGTIK
jgi:hypothetical protein